MVRRATHGVRFLTADVFTDTPCTGNQLAVIPDGRGLTTPQMAALTREFNYAETVFVLPPDDAKHTRRLRIFTPGMEVPFAGHPTVGTAFVLAAIGEIPLPTAETRVVFEEGVGPIPVVIHARDGAPVFSQLSVAQLPVERAAPDVGLLADVLSLPTAAIQSTGRWVPTAVSCGLPFLFVPLVDRGAVASASVRVDLWNAALREAWARDIMVFAFDAERPGSDIRARMFGPGVGVSEDPATGSACAALGGYLAARSATASGTLRWIVEQGFEMGRPSLLHVEADKSDAAVTAVRVGGASVLMAEGTINVPAL
jgi:trans-2,3-dihydro-3-hydroxyanthranilate isomerase